MEKELKDYLHLYLGCECLVIDYDGKDFRDHILNVEYHKKTLEFLSAGIYTWGDIRNDELYNIKPILRPLSDMTEEEKIYNNQIETFHTTNKELQRIREAERTLWLLSKHFDLFGLIEAGLAIDKTTM